MCSLEEPVSSVEARVLPDAGRNTEEKAQIL